MSTVKDIIEQAYTKVNGEYELLAEGSDDFKTYLNVLNQVMESWAHTPYVKWQSLFNMNYKLAEPVEASKLIYAMPEMERVHVGNTPFDSVYFVDEDGTVLAKYKMTDQAFFDSATVTDICMMASDGLHLKSVTDKIVGTSIRLPAYIYPPVYTTGSQTVVIDSVPWLVTSMAAYICDSSPVPFIARNADKFAKQADIYMKDMRDNNRHRQHLVIKSVSGAGNRMPTEELLSLVGVSGILGSGSGGSVLDGGSA